VADRVDKGWMSKGLTAYSTPAILGTLSHYGVSIDEAGYRALAKDQFPFEIAEQWHQGWRGTGQFARFPSAASVELWRRLEDGKLMPTELGDALAVLLATLEELRRGSPEAKVEAAFAGVRALLPRLPEDLARRRRFVEEAVTPLGASGIEKYERMAEQIAQAGHVDDAEAFAELDETLLPERRGILRAVVQGASGNKEGAVAQLVKVLEEEGRADEALLYALEVLEQLKASAEAIAHGERLLDRAEKAEEHHLALGVAERLASLYEAGRSWEKLRALADRVEALQEAHRKAHPHHHH
jgi:tetratricopeptide (TPR) repeat protein